MVGWAVTNNFRLVRRVVRDVVRCVATTAALFVAPASGQEPERVAQAWILTLAAGKWAEAAAQVSEAVPPGRMDATQLERIWRQIEMTAGRLRSAQAHPAVAQDTFQIVPVAADFERQQLLLRVVITRSGRVGGVSIAPPAAAAPRVPPYADTSRIREEAVEFGAEPWRLPGTLTLPKGAGPFPIVVLVHGSGPNDRDETYGPNRPFRDLALGLGARGIAVLRYDKRTLVHRARVMGSDAARLTVEQEVIEDALAALRTARGHASIDARRVYLLGHSLGGQLAPEIAARDSAVAGVILLAAPTRPLTVLMNEQFTYLSTLPQNAGEAAQAQIRAAQEALGRYRSGSLPDSALVLGASAGYLRDLDARDAVAAAQRLSAPLLILQGERDYQVTMEDFRRWQTTFAGKANGTVQSFPNLNHHFIAASGTPNPIEYSVPGHVAVEVIDAIANWIRR